MLLQLLPPSPIHDHTGVCLRGIVGRHHKVLQAVAKVRVVGGVGRRGQVS